MIKKRITIDEKTGKVRKIVIDTVRKTVVYSGYAKDFMNRYDPYMSEFILEPPTTTAQEIIDEIEDGEYE